MRRECSLSVRCILLLIVIVVCFPRSCSSSRGRMLLVDIVGSSNGSSSHGRRGTALICKCGILVRRRCVVEIIVQLLTAGALLASKDCKTECSTNNYYETDNRTNDNCSVVVITIVFAILVGSCGRGRGCTAGFRRLIIAGCFLGRFFASRRLVFVFCRGWCGRRCCTAAGLGSL